MASVIQAFRLFLLVLTAAGTVGSYLAVLAGLTRESLPLLLLGIGGVLVNVVVAALVALEGTQ